MEGMNKRKTMEANKSNPYPALAFLFLHDDQDVYWCWSSRSPVIKYLSPRNGYIEFSSRGHVPFGQNHESRPLGRSNFLNNRRVIFSYSQPIRFVRLDPEHTQNEGKSLNRGLQCWTFPEVASLGADQKERSLWEREWASCQFQNVHHHQICSQV